MTLIEETPETTDVTAEEFAEQLLDAVLGAQRVQAAFAGERLGWYDALAEGGPLSSSELARRTGTDERYAREWLEHQTVTGWLRVDDPTAPADQRRFSLPAAHAEVLTDRESLAYAMPLAKIVAALGRSIDEIVEAFRNGTGVGWHHHGDDARQAQAAANRPLFMSQLTTEYLPLLGDVHDRLGTGGRIADVGCGLGWSSIAMALGYPGVTVDGYDVDAPSIEAARRNAAAHGVADRVTFHVVDAAGVVPGSPYDLVTAFECVHDLADPVGVLAAMRSLAGEDGTVLVMDERVGETFTGAVDPIEQLMYGYSLMCCLPDGRCGVPSAATGTVMRPGTLEAYAAEAGFDRVEVLAADNDFFRFYRLV